VRKAPQPLVVTTQHRGVFFGYGDASDADTIRLTDARMCVYWSANVKGVLGLAVTGPKSGCKIGPAIPAITLRGVTAVMEATPEAVEAWEKSTWS
jgi:hypothetical protein